MLRHNKAVGFVSYGAVGGARAAEHLLDQVVAWSAALAPLRQPAAAAAH